MANTYYKLKVNSFYPNKFIFKYITKINFINKLNFALCDTVFFNEFLFFYYFYRDEALIRRAFLKLLLIKNITLRSN